VPADDITLLNKLRKDGEITEEQYETLRRHVLWGTPLPELLEEEGIGEPTAADPEPAPEPAGESSAESRSASGRESAAGTEPASGAQSAAGTDSASGTESAAGTESGTPAAPPRRFTPALPSNRPARNRPPPPAATPPSTVPPHTGPPQPSPPQPSQPQPSPPRTDPSAGAPPQSTGVARPRQAWRPPPSTNRPIGPNYRSANRPPVQPQPPVQPPPPRQPVAQGPPPRPAGNSLRVPLLAGGGALVLAIALVLVWWFVMRGDGSVSTAKYANSACGDLSSWQGDIAKSAAAMTTAVGNAGDASGKQKAAQTYFSTAGTRTDQLISALGDDGTPKDGKAYAKELVAAVRTATASFKSSAQQTGELETSANSFDSGLQVIIRDPQQPVDTVRQELTKASGALGAAFSKTDSCASLRVPKP